MPNKDVFVLTRPTYEQAVAYGSAWLAIARDYLRTKGITVIDLEGPLAVKTQVDAAIDANDPIYFFGVGHGNADVFTGENSGRIFQTCNCDKLIGRTSYLLSCMTAQRLGLDIIEKGGVAYSGWYISYTFAVENSSPDFPVDQYAQAFCDTCNIFTMIYAMTGSWSFALKTKTQATKWWVEYWEQFADPMSSSVIQWLTYDNITEGNYKAYGDLNHSRDAPVHTPIVQVVRAPKVSLGSFGAQIQVSCSQGCDLTGNTVQLVDQEGAVVAEQALTKYLEGMCATELFTVQYSKLGRFDWKAKFIGNAEHTTEESMPITMLFQEQTTLRGKVTDAKTGEPLEGVYVKADRQRPGTTDVNGEYSTGVMAPAEYVVTATLKNYWPASKSITVEPGVEAVCNLEMEEKVLHLVTIETSPISGVQFVFDGMTRTTPYSQECADQDFIKLTMPLEWTKDGIVYTWKEWSDGIYANDRYVRIAHPTTLTGMYEGSAPPTRKGDASQSASIIITVEPKPSAEETELTLTLDKSEYASGESMILSGGLLFASDQAPLPNRTVKLLENDIVIATVATVSDGKFTHSHSAPVVTESTVFSYKAVFEGDP